MITDSMARQAPINTVRSLRVSVYEFDQCDDTIQKELENKGEKAEAVEPTIQHNNQVMSKGRERERRRRRTTWKPRSGRNQ